PNTRILDRLRFAAVDQLTAEADYERIKRIPNVGEAVPAGHSAARLRGASVVLHDASYILGRTNPNEHAGDFASLYLGPLTLRLDGATRIALTNTIDLGDLKNPTQPLARIYTDDAKRVRWRTIIHEAFGLYPGVDALAQGKLSVKFDVTPPPRE